MAFKLSKKAMMAPVEPEQEEQEESQEMPEEAQQSKEITKKVMTFLSGSPMPPPQKKKPRLKARPAGEEDEEVMALVPTSVNGGP